METALEHILTHSRKPEMIAFMNANSQYFIEAIELAISDKQPYAWRAAWLLESCMQKDDKIVKKYVEQAIQAIPTKKDGHQRELIKILLKMQIEDIQEGQLFDICASLWEDISKTPSVRLTAFKYMFKISLKYPDLKDEIAFFVQDQYLESLSPGIKHSILKMIRKMV